jgi:hypothetical protein
MRRAMIVTPGSHYTLVADATCSTADSTCYCMSQELPPLRLGLSDYYGQLGFTASTWTCEVRPTVLLLLCLVTAVSLCLEMLKL